jgi:hypothetical protein
MQKEVEILKGQTFADIAIQETGILESLISIAIINKISVTEKLLPGSKIIIDDKDIENKMHNLILRDNIIPATAFGFGLDQQEPEIGGIEFMGIEIDFIVS